MRKAKLLHRVFTISGYTLLLAGAALIVAIALLLLLGDTYGTLESALVAGSGLLLVIVGFLLVKNFELDEEEGSRDTGEDRVLEKIERVQKFLESDLPTLHRLIRRSESLFSDSLQRMSEEKQRYQNTSESLLNAIVTSLDDLWRIARQDAVQPGDSFDSLCRRLSRAGFIVYVPEERSLPDMSFSKIVREKQTSLPRGSVVEVINPGYRFGDRIIREAEIVVASQNTKTKSKKNT